MINNRIAVFLFVCLEYAVAYPSHAECSANFTVPLDCASADKKITEQFTAWNEKSSCPGKCETLWKFNIKGSPATPVNFEGTDTPCTSCPCGQKCLYGLDERSNPNQIKGFHLTPVVKYRDDLTFTLTPLSEEACLVEGFSTSTVSYAILDFGTNYCNLRNLVDGAGFSQLPAFSESTNTDICTQRDKVNCAKF